MKTFCPNCEQDTECEHTAELYECKECGEDFAKYIVPRKPADSDVSMTQDVLIDIKTPESNEMVLPDLGFDESFRILAKTYPADVSAIGVTVLIDQVEALEKEIDRLQTMLKSKDIVIASQEGRINKLALDLLQIKGVSE